MTPTISPFISPGSHSDSTNSEACRLLAIAFTTNEEKIFVLSSALERVNWAPPTVGSYNQSGQVGFEAVQQLHPG